MPDISGEQVNGKLRKAGTHQLKPHACGREEIFPTYKLKAKTFAEMLSEEFGVPCVKTDVDNARKNTVFKPNQVPRTEETIVVFGKIKRELFPYLEIEEFLTKKAEFNLHVGGLEQMVDRLNIFFVSASWVRIGRPINIAMLTEQPLVQSAASGRYEPTLPDFCSPAKVPFEERHAISWPFLTHRRDWLQSPNNHNCRLRLVLIDL